MRINISHYELERNKGRVFSALLHFVFLLFVVFGLPSFLQPEPVIEPVAISVEILPISNISNVKPSEKPPEPEEKKPEEKPAEQKKPSPPVKTSDATPPPPPKDAVPLPETPKEKKPDEKKAEDKPKEKPAEKKPKEKKPKEDPLDAILKSVAKTASKEKKDDKKPEKPVKDTSESKSISSHFDPNMMMSMSEKDAIVSQIQKCWNVPAGAKDAQNLAVLIDVEYGPDGSFIKAEIGRASQGRYNSDTFYRAAADSAIRAAQRCSPLTGLDPSKYDGWHYMELNFDPKMMLN